MSFFNNNADEKPRFVVQWEDTELNGSSRVKVTALDTERDAKLFARVVGGCYSGQCDKPLGTFGREVRG